ncbi:MAG: hypothetical protein VKK42_02345 [Lyngbya sp.]|nr:hypothetical protein [Lyngbya sp.]
MYTQKTSFLWKGSTQDGHVLHLNRQGLERIIKQLNPSGLKTLVHQNLNGSLEGAVVRSLAQVVQNSRYSRLVSPPNSQQKIRVFTAQGKTRTYHLLTHPISSQQSMILAIRSQPRMIANESEMEALFEKGKKMSADQKRQILAAIDESLSKKEHTSSKRGSTKNKHQEGLARRRQDKLKRAQRIFQDQGFQAALNDARR